MALFNSFTDAEPKASTNHLVDHGAEIPQGALGTGKSLKTKEALCLFVRTESCVLSDIAAGPGIT